jgi:hypothetical protein
MFEISKDLNDAVETLLKKLPLETVTNIWDAWRMQEHRKGIVHAAVEKAPEKAQKSTK